MKTKNPQKQSAKRQSGKKSQAKSGKKTRALSDASLDKLVGGVGISRPRPNKKRGVPDDGV